MENEFLPPIPEVKRRRSFFAKDRLWLNGLLFIITFISCFVVGINWSLNYKYADSLAQPEAFTLTGRVVFDPEIILLSLLYAVVLIVILLGHELGHFLTCRKYGVNATLPFFIPAPSLIGTMGAFIKIRSPINRKNQLFDIGVAGPLVSFILGIPALAVGLYFSKFVPSMPQEGSITFGEPLILKLIGGIILKDAPPNVDMVLHPVAFAGWVGVLVTALNLFPIGQLDGGHVVYSLIGQRAKKLSRILLLVFVVMGIFFWIGWFIWALLISFLGLRHPQLMDEHIPLSRGRKWVAFLVLVIFVLSFFPDPVKGLSLLDFINGTTTFM
ncbi:site-2 protease family protein [Acidobacteriota bacterium]